MVSKLMTADEAVALVPDGATLSFPGNASILVADSLLAALEARYVQTRRPAGLTVFEPCNASLGERGGVLRFDHPGFMKRLVASALPARANELHRMIREGEIEAYCLPMGALYSLARESGAGRAGLLSEVGLGTFVDPRHGGGRLNARSVEELVSLIEIDGREWLFYKPVRIDVVFLKGTTADDFGNVTMESEPLTLGVLTLATAAKAAGGKVIVQVERLARRGSLKPKDVIIPGALVDGVVLAPDAPQSGACRHDPSITGELRVEMPRTVVPAGVDRIILSRAAAFLRSGWLVNLGVGVSNRLPRIVHEAGLLDRVTFSTEHGAFGGLPAEPPTFGAHINPSCIVDPTDIFNLYTGGVLDACFLGMAEVDGDGNVNVSRFGTRVMGPGGFMDITARTPRIFLCGQFAAGGMKASVRDGRLSIDAEGRQRKLVAGVDQITLNGKVALSRGQKVTLITERALFDLDRDGWILREIAPGVTPERDIAPLMEFPLRIAPDLRPYPAHVMGSAGSDFSAWLRERWTSAGETDRIAA